MSSRIWEFAFDKEIERALRAQREGNEGMARVCARRAAGVIAGEYLTGLGMKPLPLGALDRLKLLADRSDIPPLAKEVSQHFLVRVDGEHRLPVEVDLIRDVYVLMNALGIGKEEHDAGSQED